MLDLAEHLKSDCSHVARTLSLVNLAPDIITAVMSGKAPGTLTLTKSTVGIPRQLAGTTQVTRYGVRVKK